MIDVDSGVTVDSIQRRADAPSAAAPLTEPEEDGHG